MTKVLVVGGTGVTGRLVRAYLQGTSLDVFYSSRKVTSGSAVGRGEEDDAAPGRCVPLTLTPHGTDIADVFRPFDLVVNCTGPFELLSSTVAESCIAAGTDYIDVNDSIDARREIMALDGAAVRAGVSVLTGFGLCPGLSTALIMTGAEKSGNDLENDPRQDPGSDLVERIKVTLRIGANQESGPASVQSMFRTMRGGYRILAEGQVTTVTDRESAPEGGSGYECPDIDTVQTLFPQVRDYSYHAVFDALDDKTVGQLQNSRVFTLPVVSRFLARLAASGVSKKARQHAAPDPAELTVTLSGPAGDTRLRAVGPGSYAMTAAFAAGAALAVRHQRPPLGCHDLAGVPYLRKPVLAFLKEQGVRLELTGLEKDRGKDTTQTPGNVRGKTHNLEDEER